MHNFFFNGKWLSQFGGRIVNAPFHSVAQRDFEFVSVPGRNGDIIQDNRRYKNVEFELQIALMPLLAHTSAQYLAYKIIDWLTEFNDYQTYKDTYNKGYYCYAVVTNLDTIQRELLSYLTTTVKFSRKPYWYAQTEPINLVSGQKLNLLNHERMTSNPLYKLTGTGASATLTINGETLSIKNSINADYTVLDGENMQYYSVKNGIKSYISPLLPQQFKVGENEIIANQVIGSLTLEPNWRRL